MDLESLAKELHGEIDSGNKDKDTYLNIKDDNKN
jgi:hypothetical protein